MSNYNIEIKLDLIIKLLENLPNMLIKELDKVNQIKIKNNTTNEHRDYP